jgi:hypothetical protein
MKLLRFGILMTTAVLITTVANAADDKAGFQINPSVMYSFADTTEGTTAGIATTRADVGLGYKFSGPFYVGGTYSYYSAAGTGSTTGKDTATGYGPTVGLQSKGFRLHVTYFVGGSREDDLGNSLTKYTSGSGYAAAISYLFNVSSSFALGPELTYRSIKYTKKQVGAGAETSVDHTDTDLSPYIALSFKF